MSAPSLIQGPPKVASRSGDTLPQQAKLDKALQSNLPMPLGKGKGEDDHVLAEFNAELEMTLLSLLM